MKAALAACGLGLIQKKMSFKSSALRNEQFGHFFQTSTEAVFPGRTICKSEDIPEGEVRRVSVGEGEHELFVARVLLRISVDSRRSRLLRNILSRNLAAYLKTHHDR